MPCRWRRKHEAPGRVGERGRDDASFLPSQKGEKSRTSRGVGAAGALKGRFGSAGRPRGIRGCGGPGGVYFMVFGNFVLCDMGYALIIFFYCDYYFKLL